MSMISNIKSFHEEFSKLRAKYSEILKLQNILPLDHPNIINRLYSDNYIRWTSVEARKYTPIYNIIYCFDIQDIFKHPAFKNNSKDWKFITDNEILVVVINVTFSKDVNKHVYREFLKVSEVCNFLEVDVNKSLSNVLNFITSKNIDVDVEKFLANIVIKK